MTAIMLATLVIGAPIIVAGPGGNDAQDSAAVAEVLRVEDALRQAKLAKDIDALARIISDSYRGVNQNGNFRTKRDVIGLFASAFKIQAMALTNLQVVIAGNVATVTGDQEELTCATEALLFVRTYVRRGKSWQLLSSAQLRKPQDLQSARDSERKTTSNVGPKLD
jgi:hypothetical protein